MKRIRICAAVLSALCFATICIEASAQKDILQEKYAEPGVAASFFGGGSRLPLPAYRDREAWNLLCGDSRENRVRAGEKYLSYAWKHVPATAYLEYERSGDRNVMQDIETANRTALVHLMLAELAEGKGRFIDQIANGMWFASQQTSWVLSAHQPRQTTKRSLPDDREHLIDLASGRFGAILAIARHFFRPEIDSLDPSINAALERALKKQILDPYLDAGRDEANWWLGFNEEKEDKIVNNWNPWCNSDVILTFLLAEENPERLSMAIEKSVRSVDRFINYIKKDGACEEGPSYWAHAAGKLYDYLRIMYDASGGVFDMFGHELIRNMGEYISRSYIGNGYVVNFADASARGDMPPGLVWEYGDAVHSREMKDFALYLLADREKKGFCASRIVTNDGYRAINSLRFNPEIKRETDSLNAMIPDAGIEKLLGNLRSGIPASTWYPETEVCFIRNSSQWFLGAKGGFNLESHNHNDVGSFILYIRGIPVFVDAGIGTYNKETFGKNRYKIWHMQTDWHNLPMINSAPQPHGRKFKASDVACDLGAGRFSLDIAPAYSGEASCLSWRRDFHIALRGTPSLSITDTRVLSERTAPDFENFLVKGKVLLPGETYLSRKVGRGELLILCDGGLVVRMTYPADFEASVEEKVLDDPRLSAVWGPSLRRIRLVSAATASLKGTYKFKITELP